MFQNPDSFFGVNLKQANKRKQICNTCPFKISIMGIERCLKCGCIIILKIKIDNTKCPEGKW